MDITDDYEVKIPRNAPKGKANVIIQFPAEEKPEAGGNGKTRFTKKELEEMLHGSGALRSITGIIKTDMTLGFSNNIQIFFRIYYFYVFLL
uniref:Uncharacterized protein n=1 Tax=uncultured bacterium contig00021 TaxID=1181511 RepID=A0A806KPB8_9BACT|nr:hypothetical protein [uncultured bacterium contig00021]